MPILAELSFRLIMCRCGRSGKPRTCELSRSYCKYSIIWWVICCVARRVRQAVQSSMSGEETDPGTPNGMYTLSWQIGEEASPHDNGLLSSMSVCLFSQMSFVWFCWKRRLGIWRRRWPLSGARMPGSWGSLNRRSWNRKRKSSGLCCTLLTIRCLPLELTNQIARWDRR